MQEALAFLLRPHWHGQMDRRRLLPLVHRRAVPSAHKAGRLTGSLVLLTHLHNNVEGKVEQQVANSDGQQVGGEIIGAHDKPIGSPGRRDERLLGREKPRSRGPLVAPVPPCFITMVGRAEAHRTL
jgi:hypothetical protein